MTILQDNLTQTLSELDPQVYNLLDLEHKRQTRKIILIPSESICPDPVRAALASDFTNIYAEGYPRKKFMALDSEEEILDYGKQMGLYRRYQNRRYYKGCEYADFVEALACRRAEEIFSTSQVPADLIFANVQSLSGAAANNAVYQALLTPGDRVMGMDLTHGGHLTHGSPYNRSGKTYHFLPYTVNPKTQRLDYDEIAQLVKSYHPKMIVAGYSSYPWSVDWKKFREIADEVGAYLFADISHPAGLVVAGYFPSPVGYADVITFTTHKTLCGPRGAVVLSTNPKIAQAVDNAVFPGEQGGPHLNNMAAKAVCFHLAKTPQFKALMKQIVDNAKALAEGLKKRGLKLVGEGTDTHMMLVDLKPIHPKADFPLRGETASRILDLCGLVVNKNTIPGDTSAADASGIRLGTTWASQRGMREADMDIIAQGVYQILTNITSFAYDGSKGKVARGKVEFEAYRETCRNIENLLKKIEKNDTAFNEDYPHYYSASAKTSGQATSDLTIKGLRAGLFLQEVTTANIQDLSTNQYSAIILGRDGEVMAETLITRISPREYQLKLKSEKSFVVKEWLRALSDGYVKFDSQDILAKIQGPVEIYETTGQAVAGAVPEAGQNLYAMEKPYFIGKNRLNSELFPQAEFKPFVFTQPQAQMQNSCLYAEHKALGARFTEFAGWNMPIWYTSIKDEHLAVRERCGLFDVSHMGILEFKGEYASRFLDLMTTNYVHKIAEGESQYSYMLGPDGRILDDIMLYCVKKDNYYFMVVNAANQDKIRAWVNGVNQGLYSPEQEHPEMKLEGKVEIRDLKSPDSGAEQMVDIALQGPASLQVILKLIADPLAKLKAQKLNRAEFMRVELAEMPLYLSRTGYTGEEIGFELYLHPKYASAIWQKLMEAGKEFGIAPAGLGSRDSTRCEFGLPLYGHELEGEMGISALGAGYAQFVCFHKPFFVGRQALLSREKSRNMEIVRFKTVNRGARVLRPGAIAVNSRGAFLGKVTSCVVVGDGYQVGLAYVKKNSAYPGGDMEIFTPTSANDFSEKDKNQLQVGDKVLLSEKVTVLPRFGLLKEDAKN